MQTFLEATKFVRKLPEFEPLKASALWNPFISTR
jgi:hypothetical protein